MNLVANSKDIKVARKLKFKKNKKWPTLIQNSILQLTVSHTLNVLSVTCSFSVIFTGAVLLRICFRMASSNNSLCSSLMYMFPKSSNSITSSSPSSESSPSNSSSKSLLLLVLLAADEDPVEDVRTELRGFRYEFLMRKNDEDVEEVRADVPRRKRPPPPSAPPPADDDDDDVTALALSWSVRFVVTSGIPQRPDTERDAVRLEALHLGGGRPQEAGSPIGSVASLSTVQHLSSHSFTTTKHWLTAIERGREKMKNSIIVKYSRVSPFCSSD